MYAGSLVAAHEGDETYKTMTQTGGEHGEVDRRNLFIFFFSSRRRHTRFDCDWSSDVCSSDLDGSGLVAVVRPGTAVEPVGTGKGDVDAGGRPAQDLGRDHPATHVEEPLLLERHFDTALVAVLVSQVRPGGQVRHARAAPDLIQGVERVPHLVHLDR